MQANKIKTVEPKYLGQSIVILISIMFN